MDLIGVEARNFRRFVQSGMRLDGPVIAVIGTNEAGKTSFLRLLEHLSHSNAFGRDEFTRGLPRPDSGQPIARAWFAIDAEDRLAIADIPGATAARKFILEKLPEGELRGIVEPFVARDYSARSKLAKRLRASSRRRWARAIEGFQDQLTEAALGVENEDVDLTPAAFDPLDVVGAALQSVDQPDAKSLAIMITDFLSAERDGTHPNTAVVSRLMARRPTFLWLDDRDRTLDSEYDLTGNEVAEYPPALRSLGAVAGLDLQVLRTAILEEDHPVIETLEDQANRRLEQVFKDAWKQTSIEVRVGVNANMLRVFVRDEVGKLTSLAERSEGLRAFVAMVAFLAERPAAVRPILLVDEAEAHLHYAAQADIVRVFTKQPVAAKIIYTTHSIGCLPEDLGSGIRAIETDGATSRMDDQVWVKGPGFSPLVIAMGASVVSFTPARHAILAEGEADAVLLPTLLREANSLEYLGYQIGPGLSSVAPAIAPQLELEAARVLYLTDGDKSGVDLRERLVESGLRADRFVSLPPTLTLEDLVEESVYLDAVNDELDFWASRTIPAGFVKAPNRSGAVSTWCKAEGLSIPSKVAVAGRIVSTARERSVLDPTHGDALRNLHQRVLTLFAP